LNHLARLQTLARAEGALPLHRRRWANLVVVELVVVDRRKVIVLKPLAMQNFQVAQTLHMKLNDGISKINLILDRPEISYVLHFIYCVHTTIGHAVYSVVHAYLK
jgi:hypothetical protein